MNKKNITLIAVTAIVTCLLTNTVRDVMFINQNGKFVKKISTVSKVLKDYYLYDIDNEKLADYASLGMTVSLDEPYTRYFDKEAFNAYKTNNANSFVGIGAVITVDTEKNCLKVLSPYEDSPAERGGLLADDLILAIDGQPVTADDYNDAVTKMKGDTLENPIGTTVTVKIQRENKTIDIVLTRELIQKESVKSRMLSEGIGYLRITSFDAKNMTPIEGELDTYDEFMQHLSVLRDSGMQKLVLDVRGNPGGDLDVVCKIADQLLPEGIIMYTEDKKGEGLTKRSDSEELGLPMVILVNGSSASASEVLTGALKDHKKATVIGTKTYGKGIVQSVIPLTDGSGMSVTSSRYFTPSGVCIHGIGIEPDITVAMPPELENVSISQINENDDIQLQKAVEIIKSK